MDKILPPSLREKLWSIFLTGLVGVLLAMLQAMAASSGVECGPTADPAVAGTFAAGLRAALYSVRPFA